MPTKPSSVSNTRSARPPSFITSPHCRSCRRLDHRRRGHAVPVPPRASPPPSMRLFLPKTDPCWAKLWHRKSRTAGHQVLEEWRHWLEGASSPFTIITDHNNLQYLRDARHLNHLSIFPITYHPGSQNPKADALSRSTLWTWTWSPSSPHYHENSPRASVTLPTLSQLHGEAQKEGRTHHPPRV